MNISFERTLADVYWRYPTYFPHNIAICKSNGCIFQAQRSRRCISVSYLVMLGETPAFPVTPIRNKSLFYKWINDLFPDSLLVSLQVHIEIHWNVGVGIRNWSGKIRLHSWAPMWRKRTRDPPLHRDHTAGCRLTCVTWPSCLCTGRRWPRRRARMCLVERWRLWTGGGRRAVDEAHRFSSIPTGTQPDINKLFALQWRYECRVMWQTRLFDLTSCILRGETLHDFNLNINRWKHTAVLGLCWYSWRASVDINDACCKRCCFCHVCFPEQECSQGIWNHKIHSQDDLAWE